MLVPVTILLCSALHCNLGTPTRTTLVRSAHSVEQPEAAHAASLVCPDVNSSNDLQGKGKLLDS